MAPAVGSRIGPYEIIAPLGAGGMGEVYRARDARLQRDVAVKILPDGVANDPDRRARFEREARAVAALSHPNILAIFDFALADGTAYAVTELLDGQTLREHLSARLPARKALEIATQIARGLAAAHDKGIIHRDLKPENVVVLGDGHVKILDFGLAKYLADEGEPDAQTDVRTDAGTVLGTVGYMAPEQVRGQAVDARTDLFALGAILYEMLAGRRAFQRDTAAETMTAILKEDPPDLSSATPDLPWAVGGIVRHCLERSPADRFQSARDLVFSLQAASATTVAGSGPAAVVTARPSPRFAAREAIAWLLVAGLTAVGITVFMMFGGRSRSAPPLAARFQVTAPDRASWGSPLGAPDGSNSGTISPDGTKLAFVALDTDGRTLLWVRQIDNFIARALPGSEDAAFPFWSPDGRYLAYFTQGRLKKIPVDGGPAQTITNLSSTARGGTWNGHGDILFATAGSPVFRVSADGGQSTQVTKPDVENPGHQWPSFLPDGQRFLYYGAATRAVYLGSLESGTTKRLFRSDTNALFAPPGDILFVREGTLFAQRFDVTRSEIVGEPTPVVEQVSWTIGPWNLGAFSASATGALTYRRGGSSRTQLSWYDRSGRMVGAVGPPGEYVAPELSPDGSKAAFMRRDQQSAGDIWTMDLAEQTLSRFTFDAASEGFPLWSPDGRTIAYGSTQDGILAKNADGSGAVKHLFATPSGLIPTQLLANPDRLLFFADFGRPTGFDIYVLPLEGGEKPIPVVQTPITDVEPQLSADGRWLAYASAEIGTYDVFVQPYPATGARWQISTGGGRQPRWRADGRELFFVTNDRKFYAVDMRPGASLEFGAPRFLFDMPSNTISVRNSYVPSRDGQRFLVNRLLDTVTPPIYVDLNWAASVKR